MEVIDYYLDDFEELDDELFELVTYPARTSFKSSSLIETLAFFNTLEITERITVESCIQLA